MLSTKAIEDKIISRLKDLPEDGKKEVLEYIDYLKTRKKEKTLRSLKKQQEAGKDLLIQRN